MLEEIVYPDTPVSLITVIRKGEGKEVEEALEMVCQFYLHPTYGLVRKLGAGREEARDVTHDFFQGILSDRGQLIKKWDRNQGPFRSYFRGCLKNMLKNEFRKKRTQKRGSGVIHLSFDEAEEVFSEFGARTGGPDEIFDAILADGIFQAALLGLRLAMMEEGKIDIFDQLKISLVESSPNYQKLARENGLKEATLRGKVSRLRRRFLESIRTELRKMMREDASEAELDAELEMLKRTIMKTPQ